MPIRVTQQDRALTVFLTGELDHHSARAMMLALDREITRRDPLTLTVDMGEVSFMDSSGIALILRLWRRARQGAGTMTVTRVPAQAKKVFTAAGLDKIIPMEP